MLTQKQISQIKEHLNKAQNPLFFFHNDQDGLCSFLLLQRYLGRGNGVAVKSFPDLSSDYVRKIKELKSDYIFILDIAVVSNDFLDEAGQMNIPVVWIDHHEVQIKLPELVSYYNPLLNQPATNEPVTDLCYYITGVKEDLWLAVVGCVADNFVPDYYPEFEEKYPDLISDKKKAFDIYYQSQIGKIARIIGAGLKDRTSNVMVMLRFLTKVKSPYEVLEENGKNYMMHTRFNQINKKYQKLLDKAKTQVDEKNILFFKYSGDLSISADLSNELKYIFPDKIVVVGYVNGVKINISTRGEKIREGILSVIKDLEDATGGGHENAVGIRIRFEDWEIFKDKMEKVFA